MERYWSIWVLLVHEAWLENIYENELKFLAIQPALEM